MDGTPVRPRVGLVEDNPDNRLLVLAILEDQFDIVEYENGAEALSDIPRQNLDLVLLDISLPGQDGTEVLRGLRQEPSLDGLPVIALTAHAMTGDRERYLAAGFDDYITKPIVDEDELVGAIRRLLAARGR